MVWKTLRLLTLAALASFQWFGWGYRGLDAAITAQGMPEGMRQLHQTAVDLLGRPVTPLDLVLAVLLVAAALSFTPEVKALGSRLLGRVEATLTVEFSENANSPVPVGFAPSPYRTICTIGVASTDGKGVRTDDAVSMHRCGFGVRNPPGAKTARGVRAELVGYALGGFGGSRLAVSLPPADPQDGPVDLQPGTGRLFVLVEFLALGWGGMFSGVETVEPDRLEELRLAAGEIGETYPPQGGAVPTFKSGWPIWLPTAQAEVRLDVAIYADDLPPTYARFVLRRSDRITVHLIAQGLSLPREKSSGSRWLAGIARRTRPRTHP